MTDAHAAYLADRFFGVLFVGVDGVLRWARFLGSAGMVAAFSRLMAAPMASVIGSAASCDCCGAAVRHTFAGRRRPRPG
jgi:hypothetical protein